MQKYNWDLKTQFVFPEEYGIVEDVVTVDIKPRFQLIETEESLRLVGIYHITSVVRFDPHELPEYSEGTLIEHLELNGNNGYFEYALPLEVNLPKDKIPAGCHPEVYIEYVRYDVNDGSSATYNWDVCCTIPEPVLEPTGEEDEFMQFDAYLESNDIPLEIPSASAFAELIHEPLTETEALEAIEVEQEEQEEQEEHQALPTLDHQIEDEVVEFDDDQNLEESVNNFAQVSNLQPTEQVVSEEEILTAQHEEVSPQIEELEELEVLVPEVNVILSKDPSDYFFDDDDFLANLSESYTTLDIKSNKVTPE